MSRFQDDIFSQNQVVSTDSPVLMLAPMEGLTGGVFREHLVALGSVDMVATEFIRLTSTNQRIHPFTRHTCPLQIQLMAADAEVLGGVILMLYEREQVSHNDWIDLNVGCPSKRVNAKGAGAALLKKPRELLKLVDAMRAAHSGPLSIKTRIGYQSGEQLPEIIAVLKDAPIDFIAIHARSKCGGYDEPISYEALRFASENLPYPVIGNGDLWTHSDVSAMVEKTGVRGVMCGRGAIANPFLFCDVKERLGKRVSHGTKEQLFPFVHDLFLDYMKTEKRPGGSIGVLKETSYWLSRNPEVGRSFFDVIKRMNSSEDILEYVRERMG